MSHQPETEANLSPLKRAILELREMRAKLDEMESSQKGSIAIVGMGLRLPGGMRNESSLWQVLANGVDTISEIPADRWDLAAYYDPDPDKPGKMNTRYGSFLKDADQFDAEFFGVSPREAVSMDPQHRLLMETSWEALENAAIAPASLSGSQTGVFVGIGNSDYWRMAYRDEEQIDAYSALGNSYSVAAGRLSYFLGLHGPSMAVDTACSASLVAVHLACRSLRSGECTLALAAGVNLILSPEANINFSKSRMLAPDGRCKTFDAAADGYVRAEGCGVVVLKTLSAAQSRWQPHPGGDSRLRGQSGWPQRRPHRAQRPRTGGGHSRGARFGRRGAPRNQLPGSSWHGNFPRRSNRSAGRERCALQRPASCIPADDRFDQNQHWPSGSGGRRGRVAESRPCSAKEGDPAPPSSEAKESPHRLG